MPIEMTALLTFITTVSAEAEAGMRQAGSVTNSELHEQPCADPHEGLERPDAPVVEANREHALVRYEKVIETTFTEASNAPIANQHMSENRGEQGFRLAAREDRLQLAYVRYRGGVDSQVNALDADRELFNVQLTIAQLRLQEILSVVQLYTALGGGRL